MNFRQDIITWYHKNKRDLPWRDTIDPYKIWLSEVILQQTRVEQGLSYYQRILGKFPDVSSLAMATEEEVMKLWQGLGYYSRARHLHQAACHIVNNLSGKFPGNYHDILRLKGVGEYSAAAIASIAFGEPYPVIDGNVKRVIARFMGISIPLNAAAGKNKILESLSEFIDHKQPGSFNQAVMELGALICKPQLPLCYQCPLNEGCFAYKNELTSVLPVTDKIKPSKTRYFHYFVIVSSGDCIWLRKRTGRDIWRSLYDFPMIESDRELNIEELTSHPEWISIFGENPYSILPGLQRMTHVLTHRKLKAVFIIISSSEYHHREYLKVNFNEIHNYPVPRLIEKYIKKLQNNRVYFPNFRINK